MSDAEKFEEKEKSKNEESPAGDQPRFKIIRILGSGGMGDVYLAEDSKLHRFVAIKRIRSDLCGNEVFRKRIEQECLFHARIGTHPNIVTLYDSIEEDGQICLILEYVEGESLSDLLKKQAEGQTRVALKDALKIAVQCLEAISRIHSNGVVHRDIKPENILLRREHDGGYCAKLMDFGIARLDSDDGRFTRVTQKGDGSPCTPIYMAPEQLDSLTFGPVSHSTDIYSMGIVLYQILSGRVPFTGTLSEIFCGHLTKQPPPIDSEGNNFVPKELKSVLDRALAKKPEERFPSARAFKDKLLGLSTIDDPYVTRMISIADAMADVEPMPTRFIPVNTTDGIAKSFKILGSKIAWKALPYRKSAFLISIFIVLLFCYASLFFLWRSGMQTVSKNDTNIMTTTIISTSTTSTITTTNILTTTFSSTTNNDNDRTAQKEYDKAKENFVINEPNNAGTTFFDGKPKRLD